MHGKSSLRDLAGGLAVCVLAVFVVGSLFVLFRHSHPTSTSQIYSYTHAGVTYWPTSPLRRTEFGIAFDVEGNGVICITDTGDVVRMVRVIE